MPERKSRKHEKTKGPVLYEYVLPVAETKPRRIPTVALTMSSARSGKSGWSLYLAGIFIILEGKDGAEDFRDNVYSRIELWDYAR